MLIKIPKQGIQSYMNLNIFKGMYFNIQAYKTPKFLILNKQGNETNHDNNKQETNPRR